MVGRIVFGATLVVLGAAGEWTAVAQQAAPDSAAEIAALKAEIADIRGMLPSQSHTMTDVEYNFANLWFAAHEGNWPLATFYFNETRGRLNWAVRVRSVRKLANGSDLDLRPILKGVEDGALTGLKAAIDKQDVTAFEPAYKTMLGQCQACHTAAEKPFLKTKIPAAPPAALIDMRK